MFILTGIGINWYIDRYSLDEPVYISKVTVYILSGLECGSVDSSTVILCVFEAAKYSYISNKLLISHCKVRLL